MLACGLTRKSYVQCMEFHISKMEFHFWYPKFYKKFKIHIWICNIFLKLKGKNYSFD